MKNLPKVNSVMVHDIGLSQLEYHLLFVIREIQEMETATAIHESTIENQKKTIQILEKRIHELKGENAEILTRHCELCGVVVGDMSLKTFEAMHGHCDRDECRTKCTTCQSERG